MELSVTNRELDSKVRTVFEAELRRIKDQELRDNVVRTWIHTMSLTGITDPISELRSDKIYVDSDDLDEARQKPGLGVEHIRSVTQIALAIAGVLIEVDRMPVDLDVVAAGGLLHDVGKLFESSNVNHPLAGPMISHHFSGFYVATQCSIPREVLHIIAYHAREGHHHRRSLECHIVYRADSLSVDALLRREVSRTAADVIPYVYVP